MEILSNVIVHVFKSLWEMYQMSLENVVCNGNNLIYHLINLAITKICLVNNALVNVSTVFMRVLFLLFRKVLHFITELTSILECKESSSPFKCLL